MSQVLCLHQHLMNETRGGSLVFDNGGIVMNGLRGVLLHIGVIGSLVCIAAKILDWYNPYMDFTGHIWFMETALYFAIILLAFFKKPGKS